MQWMWFFARNFELLLLWFIYKMWCDCQKVIRDLFIKDWLSKVCIAVSHLFKVNLTEPLLCWSMQRKCRLRLYGLDRRAPRGRHITDNISCFICGHKYKPSKISHCTHRPVSQLISYTNKTVLLYLVILYLIKRFDHWSSWKTIL